MTFKHPWQVGITASAFRKKIYFVNTLLHIGFVSSLVEIAPLAKTIVTLI